MGLLCADNGRGCEKQEPSPFAYPVLCKLIAREKKSDDDASDRDRASDGFCFELLSMVEALSGSPVGRRYLAQQYSLIQDLFSLLHTASPRIQRQVSTICYRTFSLCCTLYHCTYRWVQFVTGPLLSAVCFITAHSGEYSLIQDLFSLLHTASPHIQRGVSAAWCPLFFLICCAPRHHAEVGKCWRGLMVCL